MGEISPQAQRIQGTAGPTSIFGAGGGGLTWVADRLGWEWPPMLIYCVLGISVILLVWGTALFGIRAYRWLRDQRRTPTSLIGKAASKVEPSHLIWVGMIGAVCSVLILAIGVVWQSRQPPKVVDAPMPTLSSVALAGQPFTPHLPRLATQHDREKFRVALDELAGIAVKIDAMLKKQSDLTGTSPRVRDNQTSVQLGEGLEEVRRAYREIDDRLYLTGIGPFFKQYPEYQDELLSLMPPNFQAPWHRYISNLHDLTKAVRVVQKAETHPEDKQLIEATIEGLGPPIDLLNASHRGVLEMAKALRERVNAAIRAM